MSDPVVVTIPHRLGKAEATRRLQAGFRGLRNGLSGKFAVVNETWNQSHMDFNASLLGQSTSGMVDVGEDYVRLELQLPWILAMLANRAKALVEKEGKLMLEKPSKSPGETA